MAINVGERVKVFDGMGREMLGKGVLVGTADIYVFSLPDHGLLSMGDPEVIPLIKVIEEMLDQGASLRKLKANPKVKLDDGRIFYGGQVWWMKDDDDVQRLEEEKGNHSDPKLPTG